MRSKSTGSLSRRSARVGALALTLAFGAAQDLSFAQAGASPAPPASSPAAPSPAPAPSPTPAPAPARPPAAPAPSPAPPQTPAPAGTPSPQNFVPDLGVTVEPIAPTVDYGDNATTLKVRLTNSAAEERSFRVEVGKLALKGGEGVARVAIPENGGTDWAEVAVPGKGGAVSLLMKVEGLRYLGTYEGSVRVRTSAPSAAETVRAIQVTRLAAGFDLVFRSADIANNVFTMKPKSEDEKRFSFVVENPKSAPDARIDVTFSSQFSGKGKPFTLAIEPSGQFTLKPGATQTIQLVADATTDLPPSGDFAGRLSFKDASGATKDLELRLQPAFVPGTHWLAILGLVTIGAMLSAVVGTVVPNLTTRSSLRKRFSDMRETVSALPGREQYAKSALAKELHRIDGQVLDTRWYTPSASDKLVEHAKKATELEERIALLSDVAEKRQEVRTSVFIPSSARDRLSRELDGVATEIAKGSPASAKEKLAVAVKSMTASSDAALVRAALDATVQSLPAAAPANSNAFMANRLTQLRQAHGALPATPSTELLLDLDYQAQCARLYFLRYLNEVMAAHPGDAEFMAAEVDLVSALTRGKQELMDAVAIVESLQLGVTKAARDSALSNLQASAHVLVSPSSPNAGELVNFRLIFNDQALNESPLLEEVTIRWTFDQGASEAYGTRVGQYFRRTWATLFKGKTVNYTVGVGPSAKSQISGTLKLSRQSLFGEFMARAEVLSFLVTVAGAIALAVLSKVAEMRPLETVQDYINPFLWGFGLDRMKSLITSRTP